MPPTAQDPLLAELAGDTSVLNTTVERPDGPVNAMPMEDPLELRPTPIISAKAEMEKRHSIAAGGKGYAVTVRGEYFASSKDSNAKLRKNYREVFNLPSLESALGIIVGKLLEPCLRKKYSDYVRYRTHEIVEVRPLSPDTPESNNLQFMSRPKLEAFVRDNSVPIDLAAYPDVVHLRAACVDWTLNPKGFEDREKVRQAERKEAAELAAMNPGLELEQR